MKYDFMDLNLTENIKKFAGERTTEATISFNDEEYLVVYYSLNLIK